jgi:hypothetical protein
MRHARALSIVSLAILVFGTGAYLSPKTLPAVVPAQASSRTISLVGYYPYWNSTNPTIVVTKGDSVSISVSDGGDGSSHRLLIDFDGDGVTDLSDCGTTDQCSGYVPPTSMIPTFTVNTAGNFTYYCTVHAPAMTGVFRVRNTPPSTDFTLSASPSSLSILQGTNANTNVTVSSLNGFMGTITLSGSSSPTGPTETFQTNPVSIPSGGSATSKLTISIPSNTPTGSFAVTVKGTNSTTTHSATVSVSVTSPPLPDFGISNNPTTLTVLPGSSATASVILNSLNGLSGRVSLSASVSPSGPQVSISPTMVTLTSGGSATATLTVTTSGSGANSTPTASGSYTVTIIATNSSLSHSATINLTVGSSSPSGSVNLPVGLIVGGVVAAIVIVGVAALLIRRRSK